MNVEDENFGFPEDNYGFSEEEFIDEPEIDELEDEKEEIDPNLLVDALVILKSVAKGNRVNPDSIILEDYEGEVLNFEAYHTFKVDPERAEKLLIGRQGADIVCGSENDMRHKAGAITDNVTENPDVLENTIEILKKRNDLGYALDNHKLLLERLSKTLAVHEVCTVCSGSTSIRCAYCKGKGEIVCPKCNGKNEKICPQCLGRQYIPGPNGTQQNCTLCQARGTVGCEYCREKGEVICPKCKSTGQMPCKDCSNTGWHTLFVTLRLKAHSEFDYEEDALPDREELIPILDDLAGMLVIDGHADIKLIEEKERLKELKKECKHDEYIVAYHVRLPWAVLTLKIMDEEVKVRLFGFEPSLLYVPDYLEKPLEPGLKMLDQAAHERGSPNKKILSATKYRAIAESFLLGGRYSRKKAMHLMRKKYPVGISGNVIDKMVINADTALKKATEQPRKVGLAIGLAIVTVIYGLYYVGPIRDVITTSLMDESIQSLIDMLLILCGGAITTIAIQKTATKALLEAIGKILPKNKKEQFLPKAGYSALWGYSGGILIYFIMLEISAQIGKSIPSWYLDIRTALGLM